MIVAGTDLIGPRSDFAAFAVKHVPYLFFTNATHKDYHGQGDTAARVDFTSLAQEAAVIEQIVKDTARLSTNPITWKIQFIRPPNLTRWIARSPLSKRRKKISRKPTG